MVGRGASCVMGVSGGKEIGGAVQAARRRRHLPSRDARRRRTAPAPVPAPAPGGPSPTANYKNKIKYLLFNEKNMK